MLKEWKMWRKMTRLSDGSFLKFYIYDKLIVRSRRRVKKWL